MQLDSKVTGDRGPNDGRCGVRLDGEAGSFRLLTDRLALRETLVCSRCSRNFARIARERPVVSGQILRECDEGMSNGFTLAPEIDECEREETTDRFLELIERCIELGEKQIGGLGGVTQVAQRTRQLNGGATTAQAVQAGFQRSAVKRHGKVGTARRILRRSALEQANGVLRRKFSRQQLDSLHKSVRLVAIKRLPQIGEPAFPGGVSAAHAVCILTIEPSGELGRILVHFPGKCYLPRRRLISASSRRSSTSTVKPTMPMAIIPAMTMDVLMLLCPLTIR